MIECTVKYGSVDIAKRYDDGLAVLAFFFQVQRVLKIGLLIFFTAFEPSSPSKRPKDMCTDILKGTVCRIYEKFLS